MENSDTSTNAGWHSLPANHVLEDLKCSTEGLSQTEVDTRFVKYGANRLPQAPRRNAFVRFLLHFHNILIYVLLGAALITALLSHWVDTGVILAVVVVNAIIGFIQEGKAEQAMDAIRHMLAPQANVIRSGERVTIDGEQLVPGDIVLLEAGDKVPADLRLLTAHGLSVQEAVLTGESVPVEKRIQPVADDAALGDRASMAYSGTLVSSGQAKGVVVATGSGTEIGRISGLLSNVETLTTPLVEQMALFAKWLTIFILIIATMLLAFGYFVAHHDFSEMFMAVVGLSVAAIPEGLPAVLTITLAIGVQAMARRNAIVRRLPAIETLGSVSVICTDKTGTLTRNEMMVASVLSNRHLFNLEGTGYEPKGALKLDDSHVSPSEHAVLEELARAATLCNDAALRVHEGVWVVEGDPMEGALLAFSGKMDVNVREEQARWKRTDAIPFDAKHRFMATLNHDHGHHACIFVKGAPEQILEMCSNQRSVDATTEHLDSAYWHQKAEAIAALGQRVLAFAVRTVPPEHTVLEHEDVGGTLTLLGMVGMIDPPRDEAIKAVTECHEAGIRVIMITGDHTKTAAAIGKQIGLKNTENVYTGTDLDTLDDASLSQAVLNCDVFARTSPEHKLRLVMALQSHGKTVAMTGDGVNDAPALKRADAGIAMGKKGSEAAKEASDLVLADDNFASIVAAVREGRTVYDNLTKVISFILPVNGGEAISLVVALLIGLTLPIAPTQILWVNMLGSVVLAITLAFEPPEPQVMKRPPRNPSQPILSSFLIWRIVFVSLIFAAGIFGQFELALLMGRDVEIARTMAVNTLIAMEVFYLFSMRYGYGTSVTWRGVVGTKPVLISLALITIAQLLFIYAPFMQNIFDSRALKITDLLLVFATGVAVLLVIEVEKQMRFALKRQQEG
ncbi:cation-transporting P-type ATPase [Marinobacter nauticus]|jgi:magnesium-transporting ATPase (P-type)|uniref:ATPase, P-type (Transporting), HAD superfamily, subfamily IC n=1 Tax=Marinobacter nauticus (strain ATCC 700491 / DSM 11845 / VT8) TaxID=351348 RepID=A1U8D0_MARN8|nr:cation-transporting P-type ATPase [Marinobacter nauticus]ABM21249.1 ATPase, P-type (transporting), HAD superfamily, subfamily IC [Marinobacter nauticus VT8]MCP4064780.1 cation-transporting P-type ATPase [Gammaproteobacteria bacterium]